MWLHHVGVDKTVVFHLVLSIWDISSTSSEWIHFIYSLHFSNWCVGLCMRGFFRIQKSISMFLVFAVTFLIFWILWQKFNLIAKEVNGLQSSSWLVTIGTLKVPFRFLWIFKPFLLYKVFPCAMAIEPKTFLEMVSAGRWRSLFEGVSRYDALVGFELQLLLLDACR